MDLHRITNISFWGRVKILRKYINLFGTLGLLIFALPLPLMDTLFIQAVQHTIIIKAFWQFHLWPLCMILFAFREYVESLHQNRTSALLYGRWPVGQWTMARWLGNQLAISLPLYLSLSCFLSSSSFWILSCSNESPSRSLKADHHIHLRYNHSPSFPLAKPSPDRVQERTMCKFSNQTGPIPFRDTSAYIRFISTHPPQGDISHIPFILKTW